MGNYTVVGNLGADPQLRWDPRGGAWATFSICETERVVDRESGKWRDGASSWWEVKCSGALAEHVAQSLHKGQRAVAVGHLADDHWTAQDGTPRSTKRLRASAVGPELKWGVTTFAVRSRDEGLSAGQRVDRTTGVVTDDPWRAPQQGEAPAAESFDRQRDDAPVFDARSLVDHAEEEAVDDEEGALERSA